MNWKNILCYSVILITLFTSCYEEDKITPMGADEDVLRYEFPQGTNSWDEDIVGIYEEFGVRLIYKGFKHADFNRSWTGIGISNEMFGYDLTDEQAKFSTDFMKDHVFAYLTPEMLKKVLPDYWYMVYSYYNTGSFGSWVYRVPRTFVVDGLDFWGVCLFDDLSAEGEVLETPETPEEFRERRREILKYIFQQSFVKGNISVPPGFADRFDYKTNLSSSSKNENYYITRGFPKYATKQPKSVNEQFKDYVEICIMYSTEEFAAKYPVATYPLINEMRQFVSDYVKKTYGIDWESISVLK